MDYIVSVSVVLIFLELPVYGGLFVQIIIIYVQVMMGDTTRLQKRKDEARRRMHTTASAPSKNLKYPKYILLVFPLRGDTLSKYSE